jgi:pimeloyl-ACP methyl ester carboxylesterase
MSFVWGDWRVGAGVAAGIAALAALITGWWMPRGPMTGAQALAAMMIGAAVGVGAGAVMRSRWAMVLAPLVFVGVFELVRLDAVGPTVDAIHPRSTYGVLALVVGRGFHGLVGLVPMMLGAAFGTPLARRLRREPGTSRSAGLLARRVAAGIATVGMIALAAGVTRPASTAAIRDDGGARVASSIAELITVDIGGHDLAMMIRGVSIDNPVLLFLAGGPGGSELGAMRNHLEALEQHFVVVTWDQRGTGKSYTEIGPTATLTLDNAVADTIEVTNYLRNRFGQERIYLLGQSWGSTLGVLAVQQQPELYSAFIGTGQMVSQLATDTIFYNDTLAWARANGDTDLEGELVEIGPPPYDRMLDYETALSSEHEVYPYDHSANSEGEGGFSENFLVPEYTLIEQVHLLGAFMDTFSILYPQLQGIDFRRTATEFEIPMFFVQGTHEADGRAQPFAEWYEMVDAPVKDLVVLDTSGHRPLFEQPDEFVAYMVDTVLAETSQP